MTVCSSIDADERARHGDSARALYRLRRATAVILPLLTLLALAALVNRLLPEPDSVDFRPLSRMCLLMERRGWGQCVNHNWGFAVPLSVSVATRCAGDLLTGQRLVSAAFALLAMILAERVMTRLLGVRDVRTKMLLLLWMAVSPWMLEALVSVHLDIAAIAFVLAALLLLPGSRWSSHILGGLAIAMAYWFRFHFLLPAVLYIPLVAAYRWSDGPLRRAGAAAVGVIIGLAVPAVLSLAVLGTPGVSNAKQALMVDCVYEISPPGPELAEFRDIVPYTQAFYEKLESLSWARLAKGVAWSRVAKRLIRNCLRPTLLLLLAALGLHALRGHSHVSTDQAQPVCRRMRGWLVGTVRCPVVQVTLFILVSLLPPLFLRGYTLRLEATFVLLAFPLFAALLAAKNDRWQPGLLLALFLVSMGMSRSVLSGYRLRAAELAGRRREVLSVVPPSTLQQDPERVHCTVEFYNPFDRYRLCSPIISGGFSLLSSAMCAEFGVIDVTRMHEDKSYEQFDYIILPRQPGRSWASQVYEEYDEALLALDADYTYTETLIIIHRDSGIQARDQLHTQSSGLSSARPAVCTGPPADRRAERSTPESGR